MHFIILFLLSIMTATCAPRILVTIAPIHSLTSSIMEGVGTPTLLIPGSQSPHHFALKPSNIKQIIDADFIFCIDKSFETFMVKPLKFHHKKHVNLSNISLLQIKPLRFDCSHGHETEHHHHAHLAIDPHIWLNLNNAIIIAQAICKKMVELDSTHEKTYRRNTMQLISQIKALRAHVNVNKLDSPKLYIAFHDAYQYIETEINFKNVGIINATDTVSLSFKKLQQLEKLIQDQKVCCIFSEPQHNSKLIHKLASQFNLCQGELDPVGAHLKPGPSLYIKLMQQLYQSFQTCEKKNVSM